MVFPKPGQRYIGWWIYTLGKAGNPDTIGPMWDTAMATFKPYVVMVTTDGADFKDGWTGDEQQYANSVFKAHSLKAKQYRVPWIMLWENGKVGEVGIGPVFQSAVLNCLDSLPYKPSHVMIGSEHTVCSEDAATLQGEVEALKAAVGQRGVKFGVKKVVSNNFTEKLDSAYGKNMIFDGSHSNYPWGDDWTLTWIDQYPNAWIETVGYFHPDAGRAFTAEKVRHMFAVFHGEEPCYDGRTRPPVENLQLLGLIAYMEDNPSFEGFVDQVNAEAKDRGYRQYAPVEVEGVDWGMVASIIIGLSPILLVSGVIASTTIK